MRIQCLLAAAGLFVGLADKPLSAEQDFLVLSGGGGAPVWGVRLQACADNTTAPLLSSLLSGEQKLATLRSRDFDVPNKLSFWVAGHSQQKKNFVRLVDAVTSEVIRSAPVPDRNEAVQVEWQLAELMGRRVRLVLEDGGTGDEHGWIAFGRMQPALLAMPEAGDKSIPSDWIEDNRPPEPIVSHGIPFLRKELWHATEGASIRLEVPSVRAKVLYLLGGTNSIDRANPPWGGGDDYKNTFIGDEAGSVTLAYRSGAKDVIPFIFGSTIFWRDPYNHSHEPFSSDAQAFDLLNRALCLAGAVTRGTTNWFLPIGLRDEPLEAITFSDNPSKEGHPRVEGITLGQLGEIEPGKTGSFTRVSGEPEEDLKLWLQSHTVDSRNPYPARRQEAIAALRRLLYTFPEDITFDVIAATPPAVTRDNFNGPGLRFSGPPEAELLTHIYYENAQGLLDRIDTTGMVHESAAESDYFGGFGGYRPALGAFWESSYTRLRILTLAADMGFHEKVERSLGFFDHWLMHFPYSYPQNQMNGKPVPGHWTVIANKPHIYFDVLREGGWPTRFQTRAFGNPENDGHGLLMITHWREWVKLGRPSDWVEKNWTALHEAAEYIRWALDNPELSFSEHGLLYNESEGGMQKASMYCDLPCYLGLLGYAEMAAATGKTHLAKRWRETAEGLLQAMDKYYPVDTETWGDVWDAQKNASWFADHATLAPVFIGMDYWGYDVVSRLPRDWADRTRRTYARQLTRNNPEWCAPAGLGYGQGYITEAALLLDEMSDANKMAKWLARFCFHPRQKHPYRVPEGVTMAGDGSVWRRWGDLGNLYQLGETVYVTRLIAGVDDLDPGELKLMPRLPIGWTGFDIEDQPVRITSLGNSETAILSMNMKRDSAASTMKVKLNADKTIDNVALRFGPFPYASTYLDVTLNGQPTPAHLISSGDSKWAWVRFACSAGANMTLEASVDTTAAP